MRMKLKDVHLSATYGTTFRPEEKFEKAYIDAKPMQYLYMASDAAFFMDLETYGQYEIPIETVEEEMKCTLENMEVKIQFFDSEIIGVQLPTIITLCIMEIQPSIKGTAVIGSGKSATMEVGLVVDAPDFIETGESLETNTAEGSYVKRASR